MKQFSANLIIFFLALFLGVTSSRINAQNTQLALSQLQACPGDELVFSLQVENLNNVGAFSLFIGYDSTVLTYNGHTNVPPQFGGLLTNTIPTPQTKLAIFWSNMSGASLLSGVLVDLQFTYHGGDISLPFLPGCEIVDVNVNPIIFSTINGAVTNLPPHIVEQPQNTSVTVGTNAFFSVLAEEATAYQWYEKQSNSWFALQNNATYHNVQSAELTITPVNSTMDGCYYVCEVSAAGGCAIFSDSASLSVLELGTVVLSLSDQQLCPQQAFSIPLLTSAIDGLTAFDINIAYDPAALSFVQLSQVNPLISNLSIEVLSTPINHLALSWSGTNGVNIAEGQLMWIHFENQIATASLQFMDNSELLGPGQFPFNLVVQNATLSLLPTPQITSQPISQSAYVNESVSFSVQASDVQTYEWLESQDGGESYNLLTANELYSGVNSAILQISPVSAAMDEYRYKCLLLGTTCELYSEVAQLNVVSQSEAMLLVENVLACHNVLTSVALNGAGLQQLVAFTIGVTYDTNKLQFEGLENITPTFEGLSFSIETAPQPHVLIYWSSQQAVDFGDGKLFDMLFEYSDGTAAISFMNFTELINSDQAAFDLTTFSGSVAAHDYPEIQMQPENQVVAEGMTAGFSIQALAAHSYQWELSMDDGINWTILQNDDLYNGVQTADLLINNTNSAMDQYVFRCYIVGNYCGLYTNMAVLSVLPEMTALLKIPHLMSCEFAAVDVPLKAVGLDKIKSLNLQISYDAALLNYIGYELVASGLENATVVNNISTDAFIQISWTSAEPVSISDGTLVNFIFDYSTGSANFELSAAEVIGQGDLSYNLILNNGQLAEYALPQIITQPIDTLVMEGAGAQFNVAAETLTYEWFESRDAGNTWSQIYDLGIYQGAKTNTLRISNVPYSYDFYTYKCLLKNQFCSLYSLSATLEVDSLIHINEIHDSTYNHVKTIQLGTSAIKIWFDDKVDYMNELMIFDLYGNLLFDLNEKLMITENQLKLPLPFNNSIFLIIRIQTTSDLGVIQNQVFKSYKTRLY